MPLMYPYCQPFFIGEIAFFQEWNPSRGPCNTTTCPPTAAPIAR